MVGRMQQGDPEGGVQVCEQTLLRPAGDVAVLSVRMGHDLGEDDEPCPGSEPLDDLLELPPPCRPPEPSEPTGKPKAQPTSTVVSATSRAKPGRWGSGCVEGCAYLTVEGRRGKGRGATPSLPCRGRCHRMRPAPDQHWPPRSPLNTPTALPPAIEAGRQCGWTN